MVEQTRGEKEKNLEDIGKILEQADVQSAGVNNTIVLGCRKGQ